VALAGQWPSNPNYIEATTGQCYQFALLCCFASR
jgi:hypothetical protein